MKNCGVAFFPFDVHQFACGLKSLFIHFSKPECNGMGRGLWPYWTRDNKLCYFCFYITVQLRHTLCWSITSITQLEISFLHSLRMYFLKSFESFFNWTIKLILPSISQRSLHSATRRNHHDLTPSWCTFSPHGPFGFLDFESISFHFNPWHVCFVACCRDMFGNN
jgi:hypothetical protein